MGATTTHGLPYPVGTDRVMDGDNAIQALAEATDAALSPVGSPAGSVYDTGWVTQPLLTGWSTVAQHTFATRRIGNRVHIRGMVLLSVLPITQAIATIIPELRPNQNTFLPVCILTVSKGFAQPMVATSTGTVSISATAYFTGTPAVNDALSITGSWLLG